MSLPMNTPLPQMAADMGISQGEISQFSSEVQALTKADLLALGQWSGSGSAPYHLTINDVNSIKTVFGQAISSQGQIQSNDVNCCCCPCCCASAVLKSFDENGKVAAKIA